MECPYCNAVNRDGVRFCNNCGKPLPLRPCPHGRRKRPHSTPHLSRPYGMEEMRPKPFRRDGANSLGALQKTGSEGRGRVI